MNQIQTLIDMVQVLMWRVFIRDQSSTAKNETSHNYAGVYGTVGSIQCSTILLLYLL